LKRWQNLLIRLLPLSDSCGFAQLSKRAIYFGEFVPPGFAAVHWIPFDALGDCYASRRSEGESDRGKRGIRIVEV
jgi:hypothetical protein